MCNCECVTRFSLNTKRERDRERERETLFSFLILILIPSAFVPKMSFISTSPSMPLIWKFRKLTSTSTWTRRKKENLRCERERERESTWWRRGRWSCVYRRHREAFCWCVPSPYILALSSLSSILLCTQTAHLSQPSPPLRCFLHRHSRRRLPISTQDPTTTKP